MAQTITAKMVRDAIESGGDITDNVNFLFFFANKYVWQAYRANGYSNAKTARVLSQTA